jgi:hypothetical protein
MWHSWHSIDAKWWPVRTSSEMTAWPQAGQAAAHKATNHVSDGRKVCTLSLLVARLRCSVTGCRSRCAQTHRFVVASAERPTSGLRASIGDAQSVRGNDRSSVARATNNGTLRGGAHLSIRQEACRAPSGNRDAGRKFCCGIFHCAGRPSRSYRVGKVYGRPRDDDLACSLLQCSENCATPPAVVDLADARRPARGEISMYYLVQIRRITFLKPAVRSRPVPSRNKTPRAVDEFIRIITTKDAVPAFVHCSSGGAPRPCGPSNDWSGITGTRIVPNRKPPSLA